jgi:hypothetical protein
MPANDSSADVCARISIPAIFPIRTRTASADVGPRLAEMARPKMP